MPECNKDISVCVWGGGRDSNYYVDPSVHEFY